MQGASVSILAVSTTISHPRMALILCLCLLFSLHAAQKSLLRLTLCKIQIMFSPSYQSASLHFPKFLVKPGSAVPICLGCQVWAQSYPNLETSYRAMVHVEYNRFEWRSYKCSINYIVWYERRFWISRQFKWDDEKWDEVDAIKLFSWWWVHSLRVTAADLSFYPIGRLPLLNYILIFA